MSKGEAVHLESFVTKYKLNFLRRWLNDVEKAQFTDVHFRSLNGEGNFNWRMIFEMKYSIGEDMVGGMKCKLG